MHIIVKVMFSIIDAANFTSIKINLNEIAAVLVRIKFLKSG